MRLCSIVCPGDSHFFYHEGSSIKKSDNLVHQQSFILKIKNGQNESYKVSNDFSWKVELSLNVESGRQQLLLMTS